MISFLKDKIHEPCYFYGDQFTKMIIDAVVSNFNIRYYAILDPFQNVEVPRTIDMKKTFISNLSDFAFAVGAVIINK
jgi:ABC-type Zn2+ transport system substrate-binding protein/surface adhesin